MRTSLVLVLALTTLGTTACSGSLDGADASSEQSSALRGDPMLPLPLPPTANPVLAGGPIKIEIPPHGQPHALPPASLYGTITGYAGFPASYGHSDGPVQTSFGHPKLVATAADGLTWVVDLDDAVDEYGRHSKSCLRLIRDTGHGVANPLHVQTFAASGAYVDPNSIGGVAVDPATGDLFASIADVWGHSIVKITLAGVATTVAGYRSTPGVGQYLPPAYFADSPIDAAGVAHPFDARFDGPAGIARDAQGNLFVADTNNHAIRKITPAGAVSTVAQDASVSPGALAIDSRDGSLYTTSGHAVYHVVPGQISLWAGNPTTAGIQDSIVQLSYFNAPQGLAVDRSGNVYVADTGNAKMRKIVPADGSLFSMPTVVTISFQPYSQQVTFDGYGPDEAVLQAPSSLSFWGDALVMSDATRGTVRVLH